jgi:hypothetical protein
MVTQNPKVSAYVPQVLKDRLKQFTEERELSESQAVTVILAEYFGMNQVLGCSPEGSTVQGVTLAQIESLNSAIDGLADSVGELFKESVETDKRFAQLADAVAFLGKRIDHIENSGSSSRVLSEPLEEKDTHIIELQDKPLDEVLNDFLDKRNENQPNAESEPSKVQEADENALTEVELEKSTPEAQEEESKPVFNLLGEPLNIKLKPFPANLLAARLVTDKATLSKKKAQLSEQDFYQWIASRDPDGIRWRAVGSLKGYSKGYLPHEETSEELLEKLANWVESNSTR